jgi:hypothetical protein
MIIALDLQYQLLIFLSILAIFNPISMVDQTLRSTEIIKWMKMKMMVQNSSKMKTKKWSMKSKNRVKLIDSGKLNWPWS